MVPYYGCLLVRPPQLTGAADPENPLDIDRIAEACGAQVASWPHKTECCGAAMFLARPDVVARLCGQLTQMAKRARGDCIVTACPMCHHNLEVSQWSRARDGHHDAPLPVLFVSDLVALALGLDETDDQLARQLIDPRPLLRDRGVLP